MIRNLVEGRVNAYLRRTGINVVSVHDVAVGHVLALTRGRSGQRYVLGGEDVPLRDVFASALAEIGRPPPRWPVPWHGIYGLAVGVDVACRLSRREPGLLVRDEVHLSRIPLYFSSAKARRELGYDPAPAAAALAEAARWFAHSGPVPTLPTTTPAPAR